MGLIHRIWSSRWVLRSLPKTVYFNLHYLPLRQAAKLPVWLYKPRFGTLHGSLKIDSEHVKPGMIRMGFHNVGIYQNSGIYLSIEGNVIFKGTALIGNDCYLGICNGASVTFGDNFRATTTFRMTSSCSISFGDNVRFGWDCLITDSDFHKLKRLDGTCTKGMAAVCIGSNNWFGNGCRILKGVQTPDYMIASAGTWLTKKVEVPEYSVVGNKKSVEVIASGYWLDPLDDEIEL